MASNSSFQSAFSVVWKTPIRSYDMNFESNAFDFMNSKWNLRIVSCYENETGQPLFNINLINWYPKHSYDPFFVRTVLENKNGSEKIACYTHCVKSPFFNLYVGHYFAILKQLKLSAVNPTITIVCVFSRSDGQSLDATAEKEDKSTQSSVECLGLNKDSVAPVASGVDDTSLKLTELSLKPMLHLQTLSENMGDLLERGVMTDVQLKCGEVIIPAHKAVLASRSKVFSSMFQREMVENISNIVDLPDIEPSTLQEFLRYLYTGTIPEDLSAEITAKLYETSDKYAVQTLQEECAHIMVNKLNEENFIQFLVLSEEHSDPKLKEAVANFLIEHPALMTTEMWMKFSDDFSKLANEIYKKFMTLTFSK